jgi:hypothetical protein
MWPWPRQASRALHVIAASDAARSLCSPHGAIFVANRQSSHLEGGAGSVDVGLELLPELVLAGGFLGGPGGGRLPGCTGDGNLEAEGSEGRLFVAGRE